MKLKKYIIVFVLLLCCGCTAQYELDFNDKTISENLTVKYNRENETDEQIKQFYEKAFYAIGKEIYYNFDNSKSTKQNIVINYNYDYDTSNFNSSYFANSCFKYFQFSSNEDKYYLFANGPYKCLTYEYTNIESLDIIITTNHNVLENNANEIKDNKYIWHINQDNYENVNIKFITDNKENPQIKQREYKKTIILVSAISGIALLIVLIVFIKHKQVNKI